MNLIEAPWLPFKLVDSSEKILPITSISDPNVVDFALPRADFQGTAYQFAIGLLQTVMAPVDKYEWVDRYKRPPSCEELEVQFQSVVHAFNLTGDGPLFMQDLDTLDTAKSVPVSSLLIEAPGENGLKLNTDHFIKRGIGERMSLEMAALALFTLQINAPSGGQGHRTSLRGGGPLTTLILPQHSPASLWHKLWLNVINKNEWVYDDPDLKSGEVFPWLEKTRTSEKKGNEILFRDKNIHPLHMYWAMPRRIRLQVNNERGVCDITGKECESFVSEYKTQNYGGNYSGTWSHPLTPYKWNPKKPEEEHLSAKGQPGGINYKIWDALTLSSDEQGQRCAAVVNHYYEVHEALPESFGQIPNLWVFGYDMDNMKARGWYSTTLPLFAMRAEQQEQVLEYVRDIQKLAVDALWHCRSQIKSAWFEKPGDVKGDFSFIDVAFWQRTETAFFKTAKSLVDSATQNDTALTPEQAQRWLNSIRNTALDLFDELVLSELGAERSMAKRIKARQRLSGWLYGGKDIKNFIKNNKIDSLKEAS